MAIQQRPEIDKDVQRLTLNEPPVPHSDFRGLAATLAGQSGKATSAEDAKHLHPGVKQILDLLLLRENDLSAMKTAMHNLQDSHKREIAEKERLQKRCQELEGGMEKWKEEQETLTMQLEEAKRTRARLVEELENERNARLKIEADFKCREVEARELSRVTKPEPRHRVPSGRFVGGFCAPFPRLQ